MTTSDNGADLLARAQTWDEVALAKIYDTYAPKIYRYVYRKTGLRHVSEDLTAETFQRFLAALKRRAGPTQHLSGWLYRVAHNLIVDYYRAQPDDPPVPVDSVGEPCGFAAPEAESPDQEVAREARIEQARRALAQLTPLQQDVIVLRFLEGLSLREVARVLKRTTGSIKSLQRRALDSLRRLLEESNAAEREDG